MKKKNLVLGFMLMMLLVLSPILMAANQIVTSTANSGEGTLRDAIADVGDGETITFNISGSDVVVISSELSPTKSMTINGYNNATGNNITVQVTTPGSGGTASRIFHLNASGKTFNFSNMTIKGGDVSNNAGVGAWGGGIFFEAGTLTLDSVTISGSRADQGGGIFNRNTSPTLTNCTISDNISDGYGGGIYNHGEVGASSPTLTNCTISGNSAVTLGGGVYNFGIGTNNSASITTLTNCTISGNSANTGGGIYNYGSSTNTAACYPTLTNCTISGNSGPNYAGGIYCSFGSLRIKNTILANNSGPNADFYAKSGTVITNNGYNLVENSNYIFGATGDIYGEQANLNLRSTLADNGSSNGTKTLALYYGSVISVAVNAGNSGSNNVIPIPTTDQRGAGRNGTTDIGAYEYWPGGDATLPITLSAFTAQYLNDTPTLCWTTQSETSNAGWNIYRSESDIFEEASQINTELIPGAGSTSEPTDYFYVDENEVVSNTEYWYWLESVDYSGETGNYGPITLLIPEDEEEPGSPEIPGIYGLHQNYPNPFNPNTEISFMMKESCVAELAIYNIKGEKISTLFQNKSVSKDELIRTNWDGKDNFGKAVSSGIYLYKLRTNKEDFIRKMILLK